jgi:hypothetical protein
MMQPPQPDQPVVQKITVVGPAAGGGNAAAVYRAFRASRSELANQLEDLQDTRQGLMRELEQLPAGAAGRAGIEARIAGIDTRITAMDKLIADADAQVAKAAAVPGAVVEPPKIVQSGPPEEVYIIGTVFTFACLIPIVIAYSRRLWKRGSVVPTPFPKEVTERLARLEQSADATALEVERIGEGQRFLTRLFTEGEMARAIPAATGASIDQKLNR